MGIPYYWINIKYKKEKKTYSVNEKKLVINNLTTIHTLTDQSKRKTDN